MQIIDRIDSLHEKGVLDFIEFAFNGFEEGKLLRYPCRRCSNILFQSKKLNIRALGYHSDKKRLLYGIFMEK